MPCPDAVYQKENTMVTSAKLAKLAGWLLVVGSAVATVMVLLKPGSFTTDHPDGVTDAMLGAVAEIAANSGVAHVTVEVALFATFAYVLGVLGVERLLRDGETWAGYLRKAGAVAILVAFGLRAASYAMGHLVTNILTHGVEGPTGMATTDAAVLVVGIEGTFGLFATLVSRVGFVLLALGLMNVRLIGQDKVLAIVLAIVPGIGALVLLLLGSHVHDGVVTYYAVGSMLALVQALWVVLLGVGLIRRGHTLPELS